RYQTVAKFATDVAAVTGRPAPAAVPQTRPGLDTEGKTQLLDAATQRISAKRPAPARKRSLIPVAVGVVVILAGAGAWVALNGGSKTGGGAVSRDTPATTFTPQPGNVQGSGRQPGMVANSDTVQPGAR